LIISRPQYVPRLTGVAAACASAPAIALTVWCAAVAGAAVFGRTPGFWTGGALTLSEAAALRDQGEVARQVEAGADPNREYDVRPGVLAIDRAIPLEAAVAARRAEIVTVLMHEGATLNESGWRRLHCAAVETETADVVRAIDELKPGDASLLPCPP
jgi:hypothetical protein